MPLLTKRSSGSDDEDLEHLRLAALKSLKQKEATALSTSLNSDGMHFNGTTKPFKMFGSGGGRHVQRKFRGNVTNRRNNQGLFRNRTNTNLISIQTVDSDSQTEGATSASQKLVLPQDRYCKNSEETEKTEDEPPSKFSRYDDSEKSDSESNDDGSSDSDVSLSRDEREDSLERLMDDLENEIHGRETSEAKKPKTKTKRKNKKKTEVSLSEVTNDATKGNEDKSANKEVQNLKECIKMSPKPEDEKQNLSTKKSVSPVRVSPVHIIKQKTPEPPKKPALLKPKGYSPVRKSPIRKSPVRSPMRLSPNNYKSRRSPSPYNGRSIIPDVPIVTQPRYYPWQDNVPPFPTIPIRAPLSPRSAAFVMKNEEILARRKMSPRSPESDRDSRRSPSPRRRVLSPRRRSRSPYYRRSLSPKSSPRQKSKSPPRKLPSPRRIVLKARDERPSNLKSDRKRSPRRSPERRVVKIKRRSSSISLSPSPERNDKRPAPTKDRERRNRAPEKPTEPQKLDPVLEARKRKFESTAPIEASGIIKLKKPDNEHVDDIKTESPVVQNEVEKSEVEDELEDELELNANIDDLWSEEESDEENEGRFKSSTNKNTKVVTAVPFTQLLNGPVKNVINKENFKDGTEKSSSSESKPLSQRRDLRERDDRRKHKSRSSSSKNRKEKPKTLLTSSLENKSIEIKVQTQKEVEKPKSRKVKLADETPKPKRSRVSDEEIEPEVFIDDEDDSVEQNKKEEGDLRAELSRRRAERLKLGSASEVVPSRLLQTALEDVVSRKRPGDTIKSFANKVPKVKEKVPVHMRLGNVNKDMLDDVTDEDALLESPPKKNKKGQKKRRAAKQV